MLGGELQPTGKGITADDRGAKGLGFHAARYGPRGSRVKRRPQSAIVTLGKSLLPVIQDPR